MPTPKFMKKYAKLQHAKRLKRADDPFVLVEKEAEAERKAKEEGAERNAKEERDAKPSELVKQCMEECVKQWVKEGAFADCMGYHDKLWWRAVAERGGP